MISRPWFYPLRKTLPTEMPHYVLCSSDLSICCSLDALASSSTSWWSPLFLLCYLVQSLSLWRLPELKSHVLSSFWILILSFCWTYFSLVPWLQGLNHVIYYLILWSCLYFVSVYIHWFCFQCHKLFSQEKVYQLVFFISLYM